MTEYFNAMGYDVLKNICDLLDEKDFANFFDGAIIFTLYTNKSFKNKNIYDNLLASYLLNNYDSVFLENTRSIQVRAFMDKCSPNIFNTISEIMKIYLLNIKNLKSFNLHTKLLFCFFNTLETLEKPRIDLSLLTFLDSRGFLIKNYLRNFLNNVFDILPSKTNRALTLVVLNNDYFVQEEMSNRIKIIRERYKIYFNDRIDCVAFYTFLQIFKKHDFPFEHIWTFVKN